LAKHTYISMTGRLGIGILLASFALPGISQSQSATADPFTYQAGAYALLVDGRMHWSRRPMQPLPPASLTKVMTALVVLERGDLEAVAQVSPAASSETGIRLGLRAGDTLLLGFVLCWVIVL
jgi:D-alanyl-D-alanine carboxypeptidase (penicillin-binding protein 5/6)